MSPPITSPTPGIRPMMGSSPRRKFVPGMRMTSSSSRARPRARVTPPLRPSAVPVEASGVRERVAMLCSVFNSHARCHPEPAGEGSQSSRHDVSFRADRRGIAILPIEGSLPGRWRFLAALGMTTPSTGMIAIPRYARNDHSLHPPNDGLVARVRANGCEQRVAFDRLRAHLLAHPGTLQRRERVRLVAQLRERTGLPEARTAIVRLDEPRDLQGVRGVRITPGVEEVPWRIERHVDEDALQRPASGQ